MATLAELWDAPTSVSPNRIPSDVQAQRDQGAAAILQAELKKAQADLAKATDPKQKLRLEADIAGLSREISRAPANKGAPMVAPAAPVAQAAPQGTSFADLWESTAPATETAKTTTQAINKESTEPSNVRQLVGKLLKGGLETRAAVPGFLASAADVVAGAPSAIAGLVGYGAGRVFGLSPEEATAASQKVAAPLAEPVGRATGLAETQAYKQALPTQVMEYIGKNINEGAQSIAKKFGVPVQDVEAAINAGLMATGAAAPKVMGAAKKAAAELQVVKPGQVGQPGQPTQPGMVSMGAAAVPDATTIKQALSVASPELRAALEGKQLDTSFIRHIEADSLPMPVRLTEGQSTGDVVKLSREQNRRGQDPSLAQRFNEQNGQLVENLGLIREKAAPDVYGSKTIENSQGIIDAYKSIDSAKTADISKAYKALEDANGGQFPVDGKALATNAEAMLGKKLKTEFLPSSIKTQLERFKSGEPMTFEQFEAMRTNLAAEIRKAERSGDGNASQASSIVRQALEDLPMQGSAAAALKPLADTARSLAKQRFDLLKKDPAYKAAVDDIVPADKFIDKFVINGVNKNINTMVQNLGKDSPAHQHMAAGTVNWLKDKAGIVDETGNFSQAGYNKALKKLDDVKNLQEIFNPESASQLKTLGNVARYTQAQPRGAFVNNSNTLVGALAEKAANLTAAGVEKGLNVAVPGLQLGTTVMEMRARRAAEAETRKALETGAGTTKQTGQNKASDMLKPNKD